MKSWIESLGSFIRNAIEMYTYFRKYAGDIDN